MEEETERRPPPPKKVQPKASNPNVKTLGEVRLREIAALKRQGQRPLKVDEYYYNPYYIPERCVVCGRHDLSLHERGAGKKCMDCLGISAKPVPVEKLSYGYNPNRYLHIPDRLHEEIHRFPHRTLRFAALDPSTINSPVHPTTLRPDLHPPEHPGAAYQERTFTNYPPACVPSSLPVQTFLSPTFGISTYVPPVIVSDVPAKSLPQTHDDYVVPQFIRDSETGKGVRPYGAFASTYTFDPTYLPTPTFIQPSDTIISQPYISNQGYFDLPTTHSQTPIIQGQFTSFNPPTQPIAVSAPTSYPAGVSIPTNSYPITPYTFA